MIKKNSLTPKIKEIIFDKSTEVAFTGTYNKFNHDGTYICRNCGTPLFLSTNKFDSGSGWPSFDQEIPNKIAKVLDKDGIRTEALCNLCSSHLGHVFYGENFTILDTRYCINSASIEFLENTIINNTEEIIVAAGCFWGVEYLFKSFNGVLKTEVGYVGGDEINPTYELVCKGDSGYVEAVRIVFDPNTTSLNKVLQYFFEIHDFTQTDGQGNDVGNQYLSKIFYFNKEQYIQINQIIELLRNKNYQVATLVEEVKTFWKAENYHQNYYNKNSGTPYCHFRKEIF